MKTLMDVDEVTATVYREQGFIVMTSYQYIETGSIHRADYYGELETRTAMRCIGRATHEEFARQVKRMNALQGIEIGYAHQPGAKYYRMEPCD